MQFLLVLGFLIVFLCGTGLVCAASIPFLLFRSTRQCARRVILGALCSLPALIIFHLGAWLLMFYLLIIISAIWDIMTPPETYGSIYIFSVLIMLLILLSVATILGICFGAKVGWEIGGGRPINKALNERMLLQSLRRFFKSKIRNYTLILLAIPLLFSLFLRWSRPPIHEAVRSDDIDRVKKILSKDPEAVNWKEHDEFQATPLSVAVTKENIEMIRMLIDSGANVNEIVYGASILAKAVLSGDCKIVKLLLESGANVDPEREVSQTPLMVAVERRSTEIAELLIANGANVNRKLEAGRGVSRDKIVKTALKKAAESGSREMIKLLLDNGAEINAKGQNDDAAIHKAIVGPFRLSKHKEVVSLLLNNGAKVNDKGFQGKTPLHYAVEGHGFYIGSVYTFVPVHTDVMELLIMNGADVNAKDDNGFTPLDYATKNKHNEIASILRKYGAK